MIRLVNTTNNETLNFESPDKSRFNVELGIDGMKSLMIHLIHSHYMPPTGCPITEEHYMELTRRLLEDVGWKKIVDYTPPAGAIEFLTYEEYKEEKR